MAKAEIVTPDGIKIKIDGTPEEVAQILEHARQAAAPMRGRKATKPSAGSARKQGLPELLDALRAETYFKDKRSLGDISSRLGEIGSHYSGTTLGKQLLREVRARRLRRLREGGKWVYVQ